MASAHHRCISRQSRCLENGASSRIRDPILSGGGLSVLVDFLGSAWFETWASATPPKTSIAKGERACRSWMQTTMSRPLPPELLDLIVDHLRNESAVHKACCIVSKSWVSRTRKHLFAHIRLRPPKRSVELWKQTFPDPSNSLAHYTGTMSFIQPTSASFVNPDVTGWICSFRHVEDLFPGFFRDNYGDSLVQLHGFFSALRSLSLMRFAISLSEVFNIISSFPLLEDLMLMTGSHSDDTGRWISSSTTPRFTGSLQISEEIPSITRWLCGLPGGLRFREVDVSSQDDDTSLVAGLVV